MTTDDAPAAPQSPYSDGSPYPITAEVLAGILHHCEVQDQRQLSRAEFERLGIALPFSVFAVQALRSLVAEVKRLWSPLSGGTVFLERHGCGHSSVIQGTPNYPAGNVQNVHLRVSVTDANCIACEMRPGLDAEPALRKMAANQFERRRRMLAEHR